jgi:O-antigen ligase
MPLSSKAVKTTSIPVALPIPAATRATAAYIAFLAFIVTVYSAAGQLFPPLERLAPGKTVIAIAAAALVWSCTLGGRPFRFAGVAGGMALYLFFGIVAASPLWSDFPDVSAEAAAESLKYIVAFIVAANVLDTGVRIRRALGAIVLATLFPAIGAIHGYLTGAHIVEGSRAAWIGVFGNPNILAYHLVLSTPLALALRDATPAGPHRFAIRSMWLGTVAVFAGAILLSGSRGGTLGLAAVLLVWLARSLAKGRLAIGGAAALIIALLMTPSSPFNREETRETLSGQVDPSAQGRIDAWRTAERMVLANAVTGVGAGAFVPSWPKYAPGDTGSPRATHNSFAMIAAELGLPALLIFGCALGGGLLAMGRVARRAKPRTAALARGIQTSLFGFIACSLTGGYAFTWPLYFVLGAGAALVLREEQRA